MADIDVVPKRRSGLWLWIVLAIVVAVILWMVLANRTAPRTGRNVERPAAVSVTTTAAAPASSLRLVRG